MKTENYNKIHIINQEINRVDDLEKKLKQSNEFLSKQQIKFDKIFNTKGESQ